MLYLNYYDFLGGTIIFLYKIIGLGADKYMMKKPIYKVIIKLNKLLSAGLIRLRFIILS
jgi:hypothetical protein